jgi:hypothetical protein
MLFQTMALQSFGGHLIWASPILKLTIVSAHSRLAGGTAGIQPIVNMSFACLVVLSPFIVAVKEFYTRRQDIAKIVSIQEIFITKREKHESLEFTTNSTTLVRHPLDPRPAYAVALGSPVCDEIPGLHCNSTALLCHLSDYFPVVLWVDDHSVITWPASLHMVEDFRLFVCGVCHMRKGLVG